MLIIKNMTNNKMYIVHKMHTLYNPFTDLYTYSCTQTCG